MCPGATCPATLAEMETTSGSDLCPMTHAGAASGAMSAQQHLRGRRLGASSARGPLRGRCPGATRANVSRELDIEGEIGHGRGDFIRFAS